jgi:hypothetical protein
MFKCLGIITLYTLLSPFPLNGYYDLYTNIHPWITNSFQKKCDNALKHTVPFLHIPFLP